MSDDFIDPSEFKEVNHLFQLREDSYERVRKIVSRNRKVYAERIRTDTIITGTDSSHSIISSTNASECRDLETFVKEARPEFGTYFFSNSELGECSLHYGIAENYHNRNNSGGNPKDNLLTEVQFNETKEIVNKRLFAKERVMEKLKKQSLVKFDMMRREIQVNGQKSFTLLESTDSDECKDMEIFVKEARSQYGKYDFRPFHRKWAPCYINFWFEIEK
jgi:hypothetical protein